MIRFRCRVWLNGVMYTGDRAALFAIEQAAFDYRFGTSAGIVPVNHRVSGAVFMMWMDGLGGEDVYEEDVVEISGLPRGLKGYGVLTWRQHRMDYVVRQYVGGHSSDSRIDANNRLSWKVVGNSCEHPELMEEVRSGRAH